MFAIFAKAFLNFAQMNTYSYTCDSVVAILELNGCVVDILHTTAAGVKIES